MARTYTDLFARVADFESLYEAWKRVRRGKRQRGDMLEFGRDLEPNLIDLQNQLLWKTYTTGPYRTFEIFEPKRRLVAALPVKDRVVQHSLVAVIEPLFESRFIFDSYACRPGKGTHAGADRAQQFLRRVKREHGAVYALKADIASYFGSICHDALKRMLRRRIACPDTLWLLDEIIDSAADPDDPLPRGLPIGNLTSQLFANIYLNELDHFVKEVFREPYYLRYMDDFAVIGPDKQRLHEIRAEVEAFLFGKLGLRTNAKTQVFPVSKVCGRPLDFLGYRIWPTHRKLRKDSVGRMRSKLRRLSEQYRQGRIDMARVQASVQSWLGHAAHADTFNLRSRLLGEAVFTRGG